MSGRRPNCCPIAFRLISWIRCPLWSVFIHRLRKFITAVEGHYLDAQELRQYLHQVMATFSKTGKDVVLVVDRSGIHRAHKLDTTLDHYQGKLRLHLLPAHCGHHLNPIEVCQTQPIKMTWCPLKLFRQTTRSLRGGCKRENEMDVHRFSRHDDVADQTLGNGLTFFKRELGKILAQ